MPKTTKTKITEAKGTKARRAAIKDLPKLAEEQIKKVKGGADHRDRRGVGG